MRDDAASPLPRSGSPGRLRGVTRRRRGVVFVVALWILTILSLLVVSHGRRESLDTRIVRYALDRFTAREVARAGMERVRWELVNDATPSVDAVGEPWSRHPSGGFEHQAVGAGTFHVRTPVVGSGEGGEDVAGAVDENRKINLNTADPLLLRAMAPDLSDDTIAAIIDWRDGETPEDHGEGEEAEDLYYEQRGLPYGAKDAPFEVMEELLLVRGVTPELLAQLERVGTVYGGVEGKVNLNTAPQEVLEVLGLGTTDLAARLVAFRAGDDPDSPDDDRVFQSEAPLGQEFLDFLVATGAAPEEQAAYQAWMQANASRLGVRSTHFRVRVEGAIPARGVTRQVTAVLERRSAGVVEVVYWHED